MPPRGRRHHAPYSPAVAGAVRGSKLDPKSTPSSGLTTPTTDAPTKADIKDTIKLNTTDIPVNRVDPALLERLSPSVRDVAEHAAVLKSVLSRLGPIYDLVEREASRMAEVSPFITGKDQVRHKSIVRIPDIDSLCRPGGRCEKSLNHGGTEARGENPGHQEDD